MENKRLQTIDAIRGITMISMILFHFCWDLKYINGFDMAWYGGRWSYIWQQSICWTFILISGFCLNLARNPIRNGALVFLCGVIVTCVTMLVIPTALVMFGVLTMLGSSMLLVGAGRFLVNKLQKSLGISPGGKNGTASRYLDIDPVWGFFTSVILFAVTKTINYGYLNFGLFVVNLPGFLYKGQAMTYLGFKEDGVYSTDYFSLMWIFLFLAGYFLYGILKNSNTLAHGVFHIKVPVLNRLGRHSLVIYMLHQPVLYGISMLLR